MITIKLKNELIIPGRFFQGELQFEPGSLIKICGENGVGKSMFLAYCESRKSLLFPSKVSFLEQAPLRPLMNYYIKDIPAILHEHWVQHLHSAWQDSWTKMLSELNINHHQQILNLSGGQNQLLKLMLTSILDADYLFWDEPFHCLDPQRSKWWEQFFIRQVNIGKTVVVVDHSTRLNEQCRRIYDLVFIKEDQVHFIQRTKL